MKSEDLYAEHAENGDLAAFIAERPWRWGASHLALFREWRCTPEGRRLLGFTGGSSKEVISDPRVRDVFGSDGSSGPAS